MYGVSHSNRISRIDVVTRDDALEFIQAETNRAHQHADAEEDEEDGAEHDMEEDDAGEGMDTGDQEKG